MEIALDPSIHTYSGGLGILAGDMLREAADMELPIVAITLVHRKGYMRQKLDEHGNQTSEPDPWDPPSRLPVGPGLVQGSATVTIEGRAVQLRAWRYDITGRSGHTVPVYLLDADVEANGAWDRTLTDTLYGGDLHYRICQEALLGLGGIGILRSLGLNDLGSYHMNEGHSSLLTLALLEEQLRQRNAETPSEADIEAVRRQCIFTTHTPVPAGHDKFSWDLVRQVLGDAREKILDEVDAARTGCST